MMGSRDVFFRKIFYNTGRLRVVISTANLIDHDWRDIENVGSFTFLGSAPCYKILQAVWLQDIPPRSTPIPHERKVVDDFPSIIQKVLHAVNVHPALANMLVHDVSTASYILPCTNTALSILGSLFVLLRTSAPNGISPKLLSSLYPPSQGNTKGGQRSSKQAIHAS